MISSKYTFALILLLPFSILFSSPVKASDPAALNILEQMIQSTQRIKTLRFTLNKKERIDGKMTVQSSSIKMNRNPYKVYMHQNAPKEGLEILLKSNWNNNKALINTNGFPWVNVSLDPNGAKMREGQHHCLLQSGFDLGMDILHYLLFQKYKSEATQMVKIVGSVNWKGDECYQIVLDNAHFKFEEYKVKAGEDILSIAQDRWVNEYMILAANPKVSDYWSVKEGQNLRVPTDYASRMIIYVEKERMIPRFMQVYDDQGLYEQFEYLNVKVDTPITEEEFSTDYPDYNF